MAQVTHEAGATPSIRIESDPVEIVEDVPSSAPRFDDLRADALELVRQAIAAGSVDVALRFLAIDAPASRRRRVWPAAAVVALLLAGGVVALVLSMEGGNTGDAAPAPLGFADAATAPADGSATPTVDSTASAVPAAADPTATSAPVPDPAATSGAASLAIPSAPSVGGASTARAATTAAPRPVAAATPGPAAPSAASPTTTAAAAPTTVAVGALDGTWGVATGSVAGYRVGKTWFTGATEEVVGRTNRVSGSMTVANDTVSAASFLVDMASVDSANAIRDAAFRHDILNTAAYPTARFDLTSPIGLAGRPAPGTVFTASATGRFTIRGVTRDVTVSVQGRQSGSTIQVVVTVPVVFADFGIPRPDIGLATVADRGTIEVQVNLVR